MPPCGILAGCREPVGAANILRVGDIPPHRPGKCLSNQDVRMGRSRRLWEALRRTPYKATRMYPVFQYVRNDTQKHRAPSLPLSRGAGDGGANFAA